MKTKLCRPILVESKSKTNLFISSINNRLLLDSDDIIINPKFQQLFLISLDPEDKVEVGNIGFINLGNNGTIGTISYDEKYKTWDLTTIDNIHYPFISREYIKKVISTQSQLSPEYIKQFIEEYNRGDIKDIEVVYTMQCDTPLAVGEKYFNAPMVDKNNYITIKSVEPIVYTEEEVRRMILDCDSEGGIRWDEVDRWFEQNKKKPILQTEEDAEVFFDTIVNPPQPNEALINAAKNHKEWLNKSKKD